ncbi:hypothetical protein BJX76DRAFT_338422 [Aspergillus varians]
MRSHSACPISPSPPEKATPAHPSPLTAPSPRQPYTWAIKTSSATASTSFRTKKSAPPSRARIPTSSRPRTHATVSSATIPNSCTTPIPKSASTSLCEPRD